ncbi:MULTISPECIES: DNA packaging protein [Paenibacillus]|uniref:DNA packaging protein n=2 Tax=Paenibacillus polymyxa TaxID=1406 RepID=A0ABX2ZA85_PAEPO|nr:MULTISPECIES: DNA packaging protein [Paenibacillus]MBY7736730.1 DNA packaging protein [Paenibacillus polymyxa]MDG0053447.1 DNA packaging protein [Paenibacillus sp. P2(2022)]ODA07352.1 DNA packaging protein [Paenibacillus polymyxa]OME69629.1 DNA packaging protein [Paenibacillus peoriae]
MVITLAKEHRKRAKRRLRDRPEKLDELKGILADFEQFCWRMLKIKTKSGRIMPLTLNDAQRTFVREVFRQIEAGKPVRIIILKARQMGFSTVTEALIYYFTSLQEAKNAFIVAQSSDASSNLYDMFQFYYEKVPAIIKPMSRKNNAKKLTFENPTIRTADRRKNPGLKSKITVQTAESRVLARSDTIHYLHASEVAFWPAKKKKKHLLSLLAALSKEPGSLGVIESTANGMEEFKKMWDTAVKGESDFTPLFFAWFEMPDYRKPVPRGFELTEEERELKAKYGLDDEQLQWRRYTIRNDCGGDPRQFDQEYPSEPDDAFLLSGEGIFDNKFIKSLRDAISAIGSRHEIDFVKNKIIPAPSGELVMYRQPEQGKRYVLAADTAKGKEDGDYDAAYVIEERTGEMCAALHGKWDTDLYGKKLNTLGLYYNTALLAVENNNTGESVLNTLFNTCHYPLLFMHKKSFGWNTNQATRPVMISDFKEAIRDQLYDIYCPELYSECMTLIDKNGRAEADSGCHDDRIFAYSIALQVRQVAGKWFEWFKKKQQQRAESRDDYNEEVGWI